MAENTDFARVGILPETGGQDPVASLKSTTDPLN